jgi:hypothetical protein
LFSLDAVSKEQEMQWVDDGGEEDLDAPGEESDGMEGEAREGGTENEGEVGGEADAVTTRRGRTVKPPDRFRDYVLDS